MKEDEAYKFIKRVADEIAARDECSSFDTFVADSIRKLKPINQILAKRFITNILIDIQIKKIDTNE